MAMETQEPDSRKPTLRHKRERRRSGSSAGACRRLVVATGLALVPAVTAQEDGPPPSSAVRFVRRQATNDSNRTAVPGVVSDSDSSAIGLACAIDEDCVRVKQDGSFDRSSFCDEASATCVALGLLDAPCDTNAQCSPELFCSARLCSSGPRVGIPTWAYVFPGLAVFFFVVVLVLMYSWIRGWGIFRKVGPAQLPTITLGSMKPQPSAPEAADFWHRPWSHDDDRPKSPSSTIPKPQDIGELAKGFRRSDKPNGALPRGEDTQSKAIDGITFIPDTVPGEEAPSAKIVEDSAPVALLADSEPPAQPQSTANLTYPDLSASAVAPSPPQPIGALPGVASAKFESRRPSEGDSWDGEDAREYYGYSEFERSGPANGQARKATLLFQQQPHDADRDRLYGPPYRPPSHGPGGGPHESEQGLFAMRPDMYHTGTPPDLYRMRNDATEYRRRREDDIPGDYGGYGDRQFYGYDAGPASRKVRLPLQMSSHQGPVGAASGPSGPYGSRYSGGLKGRTRSARERDGEYGGRSSVTDIHPEDHTSFPLTTPDGQWKWDGRRWIRQAE